jgi:hypothetical protein
MARATVHGNWKSILALTSLVVMLGLLAYSLVAHESLGIWLYVFAFATMILGFMSKEDHIAVTGIAGIFLILILDIILRIGLLGFTECKPYFSALTGCP